MKQTKFLKSSMLVAAMTLPAVAAAATRGADPQAGPVDIQWSAQTGLGYDSNAFNAPSNPYVDLAAGGVIVNPSRKSGVFIPYEVQVTAEKNRSEFVTLIGDAKLDGRAYLGGAVSKASEYSIDLSGGAEYVFERQGKSANKLYAGAIIEKHNQVYVDHDSGETKTTGGGADISTRYNYMSLGGEAKYKHGIGTIDYGFNGKLLINNYDNPPGVNQLDHSYINLGAEVSMPVFEGARVRGTVDHTIRDYTNRHSRTANGTLANANPLLTYTYDALGVDLRMRLTPEWVTYVDYDYRRRADNFVGYNDYSQHRFGGRVLFEQGAIKGRVSLHHWMRDYPNGFAYDKPAGGAKTYSGNDLKVSAEMARDKNSAYWAEAVYDSQSATDKRYDYVAIHVMGGMRWSY